MICFLIIIFTFFLGNAFSGLFSISEKVYYYFLNLINSWYFGIFHGRRCMVTLVLSKTYLLFSVVLRSHTWFCPLHFAKIFLKSR